MPYLIVLGIIVAGIAVAIFKVNKIQSDRFIEMVQKAKVADDADDADDAPDTGAEDAGSKNDASSK